MDRNLGAAGVAATMVGGLLVGCGNSGDTSGSSKSSSGTTSTASASGEADASVTKTELGEYTEENPYHLVFAFVEFYEQDDAARTAVQDALNEYMIPKYHIEVEFLPLQYAEYQQTIQLMISGGDELGIAEEYGLELKQDEYTGKVYDWSVATEIFKKVKEAHPEMTPLYLQGSASPMRRLAFFDELADQFGVLDWEADHDSTTVVNEFETDTYKEAVTQLAEWFDAGYIYPDALTDTQGSAVMMKAGNTFSYMSAIKPGYLVEAKASTGTDCYAMYFGQDVEGGYSTTNVSFYDTGIATNSADPEMAFKFISALYTDPEVMNLWQNGIQDVNYKVLDDGTAYYVDGEDASNFKYHQNTGWFMGNQFNTYVWNDGSKDANYWDKLQHHNDWAQYSPAYGFMWDSSEYSTQITALQNALNTYRPALETGSVGVAGVEETLQKLNDALYAAGLQTVMDAKQEQLDKWLDENGGATETPQSNLDTIAAAKEAN